MDSTDYFQISRRRHWLQLDRSSVQELAGAAFVVEAEPHPFVELDGRPTMAAYRFIQEAQANGQEDSLAEITLAVTIRRIGGDWRLYAGSWGEQDPEWPDICEDEGLEVRRRLVSRLYDVDLVALGDLANSVLTVTEDEASE
tara:strand:- start:626 stop:1051 length:426 start_codon:yes stop_codon:yes gene_type:complete